MKTLLGGLEKSTAAIPGLSWPLEKFHLISVL
jgi:hypothetical protein